MCGGEVEITVMTGFSAKRNMKINACHTERRVFAANILYSAGSILFGLSPQTSNQINIFAACVV
jgi:hypothetical protein